MWKRTILTVGFAAGLALAPMANAVSTSQQHDPQCDSNYSGACVPIARDVDCLGKGGNGPAYVQGPVAVVGNDVYELDRDGNGVGCES